MDGENTQKNTQLVFFSAAGSLTFEQFMSNRYQARRTCHTSPVVTDCLPHCCLAPWVSLTAASTPPSTVWKQVCFSTVDSWFLLSFDHIHYIVLCRKMSLQPRLHAAAALLSRCVFPSSRLGSDSRSDWPCPRSDAHPKSFCSPYRSEVSLLFFPFYFSTQMRQSQITIPKGQFGSSYSNKYTHLNCYSAK